MLSGLAVCAAITALVAGVTGAWSPCGFSMVETIGSALGDARRGGDDRGERDVRAGHADRRRGHIRRPRARWARLPATASTGLREGLGAAIALAAAIADWRGVRIAPQIRRQVPERWRWTLPLPLACALYGVLLGLGFTTFVLAFAVWALAGISFAAGDPLLGVRRRRSPSVPGARCRCCGWRPGCAAGSGAQRLDEMASEPRLWLGLRRLDALGLGVVRAGARRRECLGGDGVATSATRSLGGGRRAGLAAARWRRPALASAAHRRARCRAYTRRSAARRSRGPARRRSRSPTARSLQPRLTIAARGVNALAVSDGWVVYRDVDAAGAEHLIGVSLTSPMRRGATSRARAWPVRSGARRSTALMSCSRSTRHARSVIELADLTSGHRRTLRAAAHGAAFFYPSLLGGGLLFEQVTRCAQQLRIGVTAGGGGVHAARARVAERGRPHRERVLLSLALTVSRDPGYQIGYTHAYNSASGCGNRSTGKGGATQLGSTALGRSRAYVTVTGPAAGDARIVSVAR